MNHEHTTLSPLRITHSCAKNWTNSLAWTTPTLFLKTWTDYSKPMNGFLAWTDCWYEQKKSYLEQKFNHEQNFGTNKKSCLEQKMNHEWIIQNPWTDFWHECIFGMNELLVWTKNPTLNKSSNHEQISGTNKNPALNKKLTMNELLVWTKILCWAKIQPCTDAWHKQIIGTNGLPTPDQ